MHAVNCSCEDCRPEVTIYLGDAGWHDGPGWYYVIDEYPDEGSCGSFGSEIEAGRHAREAGYKVRATVATPTLFALRGCE